VRRVEKNMPEFKAARTRLGLLEFMTPILITEALFLFSKGAIDELCSFGGFFFVVSSAFFHLGSEEDKIRRIRQPRFIKSLLSIPLSAI